MTELRLLAASTAMALALASASFAQDAAGATEAAVDAATDAVAEAATKAAETVAEAADSAKAAVTDATAETTETEAAETEATDAAAEAEATPEPIDDRWVGAEDAPLTIVEYASYTCGHCGVFHSETYPMLKAEFIDTGKVRFAHREVYFDAVGLWAGVLANCAGDEKYHAVSGMIYDTQDEWLAKEGADIEAGLRKIGAQAGMTKDQMDACWADTDMVERLVYTFQTNAAADKIDATPTFIIGGEKVQNQPWDKLKPIIEAKLKEAEASATEAEEAPKKD